MSFKLVLMPPDFDPHWPEAIRAAVPECEVVTYEGPEDLNDADAVYGSLSPEQFMVALQLRWIAASRAGLGGSWFHKALVESDVVVTGMHGAYNEHLSTHAMAFVLAFARGFDYYLPRQASYSWDKSRKMVDLNGATAAVVGVGGAGTEVGRQCAAFGMHVLGFDPRRKDVPEGFESVEPAEALDGRLGECDFVIVTAPETPVTKGMFNRQRFARMKRGAYFINISRGSLVVTPDLVFSITSGQLAGAGLDVMDPEPLPPGHALWTTPGVLITPHVAINGTPYHERWLQMLIDNCKRFEAGEPLRNVVDKQMWF
ncbi:MAG: D-2-hydroxyacid dehydrogenase [Dehalococcoidia bacterium]